MAHLIGLGSVDDRQKESGGGLLGKRVTGELKLSEFNEYLKVV